jgi:transposase-like protein
VDSHEAKARRKRKKYTAAQRALVLATAQKEGLTAAQVEKKFGVAPVTYYSWRKKVGATRRRRGAAKAAPKAASTDLTTQVRSEVRARVQQILPSIVRNEVNQYLNTVLAARRRRRRKRA